MRRNDLDLSKPTRQPISSIVVIFYKSFESIIRQFWPFLLYFLITGGSNNNWFLIVGSIGIAGLSFFFGILRYYHFEYFITKDKLNIHKGLFTRSKTNIPFERIQTIRLEQNFLHRMLDLHSVKIDTAGSSDAEITIPALDRETAEYLKAFILTKVRRTAERQVHDGEFESTVNNEQVVFNLQIPDLIKIGLTTNHLRVILIIFSVLWGLSWQLGEIDDTFSPENSYQYIMKFSRTANWYSWLLIGIPTLLLASVVVSIGMSILKFYDLTVFRSWKGFRIRSGLINKNEYSAPFQKIQIFFWSINPLRNLFGLYSIRLQQASSSEVSAKKSILVPGANEQKVNLFLDDLFPDDPGECYDGLKVSRKMVFRFTLYIGVIPSLLFVNFAYWFSWNFLVLIPVWITLIYFLMDNYQKRWRIHLYDDFIQLDRGIWDYKRERIYLYKVQGIQLNQTPYQKRVRLASLQLFTAAGDVNIPYIPLEDARDLLNFVLFKVESSKKHWM